MTVLQIIVTNKDYIFQNWTATNGRVCAHTYNIRRLLTKKQP